MRSFTLIAAVALCIASFSTVNAALAGLRPNKAATDASREDRFEIVTINPNTGLVSSTQKQLFALYDGTIDMNNIVFGPTPWVLSLQAYDQSQVTAGFSDINSPPTPLNPLGSSNPSTPITGPAYLARQDIRDGGRFEWCEIPSTIRPINIFWDSDSSVIAVVSNPSTTSFSINRISFNPSLSQCTNAVLLPLTQITSVSSNVFHQRGNRIYIVTEPATPFSTTAANVNIRSFDVTVSGISGVSTVQLPSTVVPTTLASLSPDVIVFQGWSSTLSGTTAGFATWEINMATFTSATTLTTRVISSNNEELVFSGTMVNQTNSLYTIKNVVSSTTSIGTPQVATTSFAVANQGETKATNVLNAANIFKLFDLGNLTNADINIDSVTSTSVSLTGPNAFASVLTGAGVITGTAVSQCRITYNAATSSQIVSPATGSGDKLSCALGNIPTGTTTIDVEYAADGVNFGPKTSFAYSPTNAATIAGGQFNRASYDLQDGVAGTKGEAITINARDSAGRKVLFHPTTSVTLSLAPQGNAVLRSSSGLTGTVSNGVLSFPNLAIDLDRAESNGVGLVRATATLGGNSITTNLSVRILNRTFGTLGALAFPTSTTTTQAFETHLVNPTVGATTAAVRLSTRSLTDTGSALSLGTVVYDADSKVLNTLDITSTNSVVLNGQSITTSSDNKGTGQCRIASSANQNDVPSALFYESTSTTDRSTNFIGVIHNVDGITAAGRKIIRYNRAAGSLATAACTATQLDTLPLYDTQYGNHHIRLLTEGRVLLIEPDFFFTASTQLQGTSALLSVWKLTNGTVPGTWLVRNRVISGFSVIGVTQSGANEVAINGAQPDGSAGVWTIDISNEMGAITAPTVGAATRFASTVNEQAWFLSAGSPLTASDARFRYSGSSTPYTASTQAQYIDTVQLARGSITPAAVRNVDVTGRNYLDFFNLEDPVVTAVTPSRLNLNQASTVSVTANNVITSSQLRCRFSSATGVPSSVEFQVGSSATTTAVNADGATVACGTIPTAFIGSNAWVYVQLSNDGGLNYGPEQRIGVGSIQDPIGTATPVPSGGVGTTCTFNWQVVLTTGQASFTTDQEARLFAAATAAKADLQNLGFTVTVSKSTDAAGLATYVFSVSITSSNCSSRLGALQVSSLSAAALEQQLRDYFLPNGSLRSSLATAGFTGATITRTTTTTSSSSSNGLSDGAIAGIVIGSVLGGLLIIGLVIWAILASKKSKSPYSAAARARSADVGVVSSSGSGSSSSEESYEYYDDEDYDDEDGEDDYSDYI